MKKYIFVLVTLGVLSCSSSIDIPNTVDARVLAPVTGLIYNVSLELSIMFFSEQSVVSIRNIAENTSYNDYYIMEFGEQEIGSPVISFRLSGKGVNAGDYIGILLVPGAVPQLGIAIEKTRKLAINAAQSAATHGESTGLATGQVVTSSALWFLEEMSPFSFQNEDGSELNSTSIDITTDDPAVVVGIADITNTIYRPTIAPPGNEIVRSLNFETNISDTLAIFNFQESDGAGGVNVKLWAAKIDFTNYRLQFVESPPVSTDPTFEELANFVQQIGTVSTFDYTFPQN